MLKNYIKISLRNLSRHKIYTIINIAGLSIGMACALLLYLYIRDELSFDKYHEKADRIYRVSTFFGLDGQRPRYFSTSSEKLGPVLLRDYPEVDNMVRLFRGTAKKPLTYQDKKLYANSIHYADSTYFQVFSHKLIKGNPKTALVKPNSIVLNKTLAKKLFGRAGNAIGKVIKLFDYQNNIVTGVMEDLPGNSHLKFPALVSYSTIYDPKNTHGWGSANFYTYILLKPNTDIDLFQKKIQKVFDQYMATGFKPFNATAGFRVDPLTGIHLSTFPYEADNTIKGNKAYLLILGAIAVFILVIASINYMNLATARSTSRAKEVGIRKVVGSYRSQLIAQFLIESILLAFISLLLSISLAELSLPYFNQMADKNLTIHYFGSSSVIGSLVFIMILVGLFSGSYPAFFLSSFHPVRVLKGKYVSNRNATFLRKGLVIFQFSISIMMIIGTWIVYNQLQFIRNTDLGFTKDQVVVLRTFPDTTNIKRDLHIKEDLLQHPGIKNVAFTSNVPGRENNNSNAYPIEQANGQMKITIINSIMVDYAYLNMMGLKLKQGRYFSPQFKTDTSKAVVVNEMMVKKLGWKKALGKKLYLRNDSLGKVEKGYEAKVIGVIKDFHTTSLHKPIEPLLLKLMPPKKQGKLGQILIRINKKNTQKTLKYIKKIWYKHDKKYAYQSYFLSQNFNAQYKADERQGEIFMAFSGLTIFIACLGLLGLASFTAEQRVKEIGVRKVLGASIPGILRLMSFDFLRLVLWASLFGSIAGAFMMHQWLQNFAYHLPIYTHWFVFILSALLALGIALLTVSVQVLKVSQVNPVEVLKDE